MRNIKLEINRFEVNDEIAIEVVSSADSVVQKLEQLDNKLNNLQQTLNKQNSNTKKIANSLKELSSDVEKNKNITSKANDSWSKFSKTLTGNLVRFRIIKDSITAVGSEFTNLLDKAAELEESLNLYTLSLGEYRDQGKAWASEISDALYLDPTTIYQYDGALNSLITGLDVSADKAYLMSTNLTQLAFDMSSYLNMDYQTAYDRIQSGISGQIKGLRQAGIALTEASLQELAYSLGIEKSIEHMTEAEKVQLRYIQIMRSTKNMQGDLARTMMTPMNAMRMVQQQFQLLGRAIGQVFLPIVMKAIPYVMALTNMLIDLANWLSNLFGYEMVDIDYSSVSNFGGELENLGKTADNTGKKVKKMLAPFDDLNVVMSSSSGGSSNGSDDLIDFSKYLTGYDMLEGWTDQFQKSAEAAEETIKKLLPWVVLLGGAFAVKKVLNFKDAINTLTGNMKNNTNKTKTFASVWTGVVKKFKDGKKAAEDLGKKGLSATISGLQNILTPAAKVAGTIGLSITSFVGASNAMRDLATGSDTLGESMLKLAGFVGVPALIAAGFVGPWAAAAVGIAGVTGAIFGYRDELKKAQEQQEYQKKYDTLFDGQGISIDNLMGKYNTAFETLTNYNTKQDEVKTKLDEARTALDNAVTGIENVHSAIANGDYKTPKEEANAIRDAYNDWATAANNVSTAEHTMYMAQQDYLRETGRISDEEYKKRKKNAEELLEIEIAQNKGYAAELAKLQIQLKANEITQSEYNAALDELHKKYVLADSSVNDLSTTTKGYVDIVNQGIDLEDPEKLSTIIQDLKKYYDDLTTATTNNYNSSKTETEDRIKDLELQEAKLRAMGDTESVTYKTVKANLDDARKSLTESAAQYETDIDRINSTRKDAMLTIYAQLSQAGLDTQDNFKSVTKEIKTDLESLGNVDLAGSVTTMFDDFTKTMIQEGTKFNSGQIKEFQKYGADWGTNTVDAFESEFSKELESRRNSFKKTSKDKLGTPIGQGMTDFSSPEVSKSITENTTDLRDNILYEARNVCGIKSPSRVMRDEVGKYLGLGVTQGLIAAEVLDDAKNSSKVLLDTVKSQFDKTTLSFKIDTSIEKSFNSLLTKLQSFCNKWRTATNKLMSNMKNTMNSISLNKDGKITYSSMPKVTVDKFEEGGFPTSGDLFFANENGVPEYITSIGGRSAVANQDQMVSALSGAIITAMSKIPTGGGNGDVVVYIGNDKVYQGQGEYQNRQSDRYGTTKIVKI